ncbi:NAS-31 protein [Aphelenchoides avenae]|nr:NAS-31 protein [Aphelenchus avenae]
MIFGTTTHEIAHTLGLFHEQSRTDRDSYISLIQANVGKGWASQYAKEPASHQTSLNVPYDYGSVMHYSAYDPSTEVVIILAKKKPYQHSMGNNYGPIFNDLLLMNKYYKCSDHCTGGTCKNNGFSHPRDCSKCICPNGFGGDDCSERQPGENGAPPECGETVLAKADFQELSGSVDPGPGSGKFKITEKQAGCHFHIKAPPGLHVEVRVKSLSGACTPECYFGSTEIKYEDFTSGGVRMCCPSHINDVGAVVSNGELAIVSVYSQKGAQTFTLEYRATAAVSSGPGGKCEDSSDTCEKSKFICDHDTYRSIMANQCKRTCGYCTSPPNAEPPSSSSSGGGGTPATACKDDSRCKSWVKSGFCKQSFYTDAMKKQYCPKSCGLC